MENYEKIHDLVSGRYGPVYQARHRTTGEVVTVKEFNQDGHHFGLREKDVLSSMPRSKYVLKFLAHHWKAEKGKKKTLCLVFEDRQQMRPLRERLALQAQPMSLREIKGLLYQFLVAVDKCHSANVIHRGLLPDNLLVLLGNRLGVRVSDFRWAKCLSALHALVDYGYGSYSSDDEDPHNFTPPGEFLTAYLNYSAPELLMGAKTYSKEVDIWSLAMIFAEMKIGRPLVDSVGSTNGQLRCIFRVLGKPTVSERTLVPGIQHFKWSMFENLPLPPQTLSDLVPGLGPEGIDLLRKMLEWVPSRRISANQALSHAFFRDAPFDDFF